MGSPTTCGKNALVIPALNEEASLGQVLEQVPSGLFDVVIVADNGSTDQTARKAAALGVQVISEPRRGYGGACLRGLEALPAEAEIVVFMDGDGSDDPREAARLLSPITADQADLVLGSRVLKAPESGALQPHQRLGNRLVTALLALLFGHRYTDLGPFRAIRVESLRRLEMADRGYGWTVEMQIKALLHGLRVTEVPVSRRPRTDGTSKVSGSVRGSIAAGCKILWTVLRAAIDARAFPRRSTSPVPLDPC